MSSIKLKHTNYNVPRIPRVLISQLEKIVYALSEQYEISFEKRWQCTLQRSSSSWNCKKYDNFKLSKESRCASRISGTKEQRVPHSSAGEAAAPAQNYTESNEHWKSWGLTKTKSPKFWFGTRISESVYTFLFSFSKISALWLRVTGFSK